MSRKRHTAADEPFFLMRALAAEFRDGQTLKAHAHSWGQIIYASAGVLSVWTAQGSWVAPPHWAIWAPPHVAHAMRFTGAVRMRSLYLKPGQWPQLPETSAVLAVSPLLRELILRATEIGMLDEREPAHALIADLIVHEVRTRSPAALDLPLPKSAALCRVAEEITSAPARRLTHADLAGRTGLGVRSLERAFIAETGLSLGAWRRQARLLHALRRLGSGASVKEAAQDAGYSGASAFIAAFRANFGTTPGRYFEEQT